MGSISVSRSLLVLVFSFTFVFSHKSPAYNHDTAQSISNSHWLASVSNETYLFDISLPGTHETLSFYGGSISKCQSLSLEAQLGAGIRVLDIRCRHIDNKFAIHHGMIFQHIWFNEVLKVLQEFLEVNPSEFILMRVKEEYDASNNSRSFEATFESYWEDFKSIVWYPTTQHPKVKDIRGKVVILDNFSSTNTYGLNYGSKELFEIQDDFHFKTNWDLYNKWVEVRNMLVKADGSRYTGSQKMFINYLSGSYGSFPFFVASGHSTPGTGSKRLATGLVDPIEKKYPDFPRVDCVFGLCTIVFEGTNILTYNLLKKVRSFRYVGILMVDFPGDGLIQAVIDLNKKHLSTNNFESIWTTMSIAILVSSIFILSLIVVVYLYLRINQRSSSSSWLNENLSEKQLCDNVKVNIIPYQRFA